MEKWGGGVCVGKWQEKQAKKVIKTPIYPFWEGDKCLGGGCHTLVTLLGAVP